MQRKMKQKNGNEMNLHYRCEKDQS